ncbi:hypothetical protein BC833DRAFT_571505 [Globomyces pollinis-pini]|nr:hypothetical protein BC833DRAFT_571505 [Globomyces pollinis-pini]
MSRIYNKVHLNKLNLTNRVLFKINSQLCLSKSYSDTALNLDRNNTFSNLLEISLNSNPINWNKKQINYNDRYPAVNNKWKGQSQSSLKGVVFKSTAKNNLKSISEIYLTNDQKSILSTYFNITIPMTITTDHQFFCELWDNFESFLESDMKNVALPIEIYELLYYSGHRVMKGNKMLAKQYRALATHLNVVNDTGKSFWNMKMIARNASMYSYLDSSDGFQLALALFQESLDDDRVYKKKIDLHPLLKVKINLDGALEAKKWLIDMFTKSWTIRNPEDETTTSLPSTITMFDCNLLVGYLAKAHLYTEIEDFLSVMIKHNLEPRIDIWNRIISGQIYLMDLDKAIASFHRLEDLGIQPNRNTYECLIYGILIIGGKDSPSLSSPKISNLGVNDSYEVVSRSHIRKAIGWKRKMHQAGFMTSNWTYNSFLTYFQKTKDHEMLDTIYNHMIRNGFNPDLKTYTIMVSSYTKRGLTKRLINMYETMKSKKLRFDNFFFTQLIVHYGRCGNIDAMMAILDDMQKAGVKLMERDYMTLITVCLKKNDITTARALWDECTKAGFKTTDAILSLFIRGYGELKDLEQSNLLFRQAAGFGLERSTLIYNAMIYAYCSNKKYEEAIDMFTGMISNNVTPNYDTSIALLQVASKEGDGTLLWTVFRKLIQDGYPMTIRAVLPVIQFCIKARDTETGKKLVKQLENEVKWIPGIKENLACAYSALMKGRDRPIDEESLEQHLAKLRHYLTISGPNLYLYDIYFLSLIRTDQYEECKRVFFDEFLVELKPDQQIYRTLLLGALRTGDEDTGKRLYQMMKDDGIPACSLIQNVMTGLDS